MNLNATLSFTVTGTSTTGLSVSINPSVKIASTSMDDYFHNTYRVNPGTTDTPINIGTILTGKYLFVNPSGPMTLIVTQTENALPVDKTFEIAGPFFLTADYTAIRVANSNTEVREVTILAVGSRQSYSTNPGVFSAK